MHWLTFVRVLKAPLRISSIHQNFIKWWLQCENNEHRQRNVNKYIWFCKEIFSFSSGILSPNMEHKEEVHNVLPLSNLFCPRVLKNEIYRPRFGTFYLFYKDDTHPTTSNWLLNTVFFFARLISRYFIACTTHILEIYIYTLSRNVKKFSCIFDSVLHLTCSMDLTFIFIRNALNRKNVRSAIFFAFLRTASEEEKKTKIDLSQKWNHVNVQCAMKTACGCYSTLNKTNKQTFSKSKKKKYR